MVFALLIVVAVAAHHRLEAQSQNRQCFEETGYCMSGRIAEFWMQQGGLTVFGYPISSEDVFEIEGQPIKAQWFERYRIEVHPQNDPPYDIQLGRMGADVLAASERDMQRFARETPRDNCRFFSETGFNVCDDFAASWRKYGVEMDGQPGISYADSLALFGFPISSTYQEELSDGKVYTVQWFERARFEYHPENNPPYHVLFGLLGASSMHLANEGDITPSPVTVVTPTDRLPTATEGSSSGDNNEVTPTNEGKTATVPSPTDLPTNTPRPPEEPPEPSDTSAPPTDTSAPPTDTSAPPTNTSAPPTNTPDPDIPPVPDPTDTPLPLPPGGGDPTDTPTASAIPTAVPTLTATLVPSSPTTEPKDDSDDDGDGDNEPPDPPDEPPDPPDEPPDPPDEPPDPPDEPQF
jgi:hypothetical protein